MFLIFISRELKRQIVLFSIKIVVLNFQISFVSFIFFLDLETFVLYDHNFKWFLEINDSQLNKSGLFINYIYFWVFENENIYF